MSQRTNIAAWTAPKGALPPFVSINRDHDGNVEVTVRDPHGAQCSATMTNDEWKQMLTTAVGEFAHRGR